MHFTVEDKPEIVNICKFPVKNWRVYKCFIDSVTVL